MQIGNKHIERCSALSVIRKMQIKTTAYLLEWTNSRTLTTPNSGEDVEKHELSFTAGENAKYQQCSHFGRTFSSFLQN